MSVTQDATSGWYIPQTAAEWTALLAGSGIANPSHLYLMPVPSGNVSDSIGAATLTITGGSILYQQATAGWSTKAIVAPDAQSAIMQDSVGAGGGTISLMAFAYVSFPASAAATERSVITLGSTFGSQVSANMVVSSNPTKLMLDDHGGASSGGTSTNGASSVASSVHPVLVQANNTALTGVIQTDLETITHAMNAADACGGNLILGGNNSSTWFAGGNGFLYVASWAGANAEIDAAHRATLLSLLQNGPGVATSAVTVTPAGPTVAPGGTTQLKAVATMSDGSQADVTATATWSSARTSVATVSSAGIATGVAVGSSVITATSSSISGTATVNVVAPVTSPNHSIIATPSPTLSTTGASVAVMAASLMGRTAVAAPAGQISSAPLGQATPAPTPGAPAVTDVTAATGTTLAAMSSGSIAYKYVVAIEGYPYLLTNADITKAVLAWSGTDWTQALGGLFVELDNEQKIDPWEPFNGGGTCVLRVQADLNDTFGVDTHRKSAGIEGQLISPCDRTGTDVNLGSRKVGWGPTISHMPVIGVDNGAAFSPGDIHVGTECMNLASPGAICWIAQRGKYSPYGTATSGSGGTHFAEHHRVMADANGVLLNPIVSSQPRTWTGRRVGVWMHLIDGSGNLNSKANAQLVYSGRIVSVADDPNTGFTVVELKHVLDEIKDGLIGRDMYSATIMEGIYLHAGRSFSFQDNNNTAAKSATDLAVVASGASGANQINAGYYSLEEICSFLNAWLTSEKTATRIFGSYAWASPVSSGSGDRTQCTWLITAGAGINAVSWILTGPAEALAMLGLKSGVDPGSASAAATLAASATGPPSTSNVYSGDDVPWRMCLFRQVGAQGYNWQMTVENDRGSIFDQYAMFPSVNKPTSSGGLPWAIFLLDEKYLMYASVNIQGTTTTLSNCAPLAYELPGAQQGLGILLAGRRSDSKDKGPVTIRQVFILETTFATLIKTLFYNSGTYGFNHGTYDNLGYGLGLGLPGELLGTTFESSIDNLPNAAAPIACVIDEPTKLSDLIGADLLIRRAFPVWKNGGLRLTQWHAPNGDIATIALGEANKAEPSGSMAPHRSATLLSDEWVKNVVKIDYNRDITLGRDGTYTASITLEDHASVDDTGGDAVTMTIKARNTFNQFANTGAGIEALAPGFLALLPLFSRPSRRSTRSIDQRFFENIAPGDIALVSDTFMRDPATGTRGVSARAAVVTRHRWNPGGPVPGDPTAKPSAPQGEVDLFFLDLHRQGVYAPCAQIDSTQTNGGYVDVTLTLATYAHQHSEATEAVDASRFIPGDAIRIEQVDPDDPTVALSWQRYVTNVAGIAVSINASLPGWDSSKIYRITYDRFSACVGLQQAAVFQASDTTGRVGATTLPFQWTSTPEPTITTPNTLAAAEYVPTISWGDEMPFDVGNERAIIRMLNALTDYKTAHQSPALGRAITCSGATINASTGFCLTHMSPIYLGQDSLSNSVIRSLTVAPFFRSTDGTSVSVRATLSRAMPTRAAGTAQVGPAYPVVFNDVAGQQTWTTTSTTFITGTPAPIVMNVKASSGFAWLCLEGSLAAATYGFAQCIEGPRVTP